MRKALGILLLLVAFGLSVIGGFLIYQKFDGYKENEEIYDGVASIAVNKGTDSYESPVWENGEVPTDGTVKIPGMDENEYHGDGVVEENHKYTGTTINWEELKGNKSIVGWITLGEVINYPIVQGNDNSYFLKHAYNGVSNANGSIFMNSNNDGNFRDVNTIIYGHNLKSGRMFGTLKQYLKKGKRDLHFYIYTPDGCKRTYEIISIAETKDGGFAYNYAFSKISDYKEYLNKITDASAYDTGYDYDITKRVVTLSTCRSTGSSQGWRVVVVGKEVSVEKVQDAASWYKAPADEHVTILDVEKNIENTTNAISNLKEQRKQQEIENQKGN